MTRQPRVADGTGSRWAFMRRFDIPAQDDPERVYLRRWRLVQTPWFGVYLHRIHLPDADRDPHDHPWPFASCIVRGGYTETVHFAPRVHLDFTREHVRRLWSWHRTTTLVAHRITTVKPGTVTLILVGRRCREWGFWTEDGWVQWQAYVAARDAERAS